MDRKISIIETGYLKLDGGAMFGVVPKTMWNRLNPPDENNKCTWSMRCLLIEEGNRKILIDTGIGNKQDDKFRSYFEPHGDTTLVQSLRAQGHHPASITDVLITHMHFDHVGGATYIDEKGNNVPTFPNATYWTNERHLDWAMNPNPREKASFLKENITPLKEANKLQFIDVQKDRLEWMPGISIQYVYGHTEAMMLPIIDYKDTKLVYCADLIPSSFHIGLPYVMSYDVRPLNTMEEKKDMLDDVLANDYLLFFEHDPRTACVRVERNERGRVVIKEQVEI
jgi:glyoxylase-like metal-dependent hydrolase (beta-lactamase superfamily II)